MITWDRGFDTLIFPGKEHFPSQRHCPSQDRGEYSGLGRAIIAVLSTVAELTFSLAGLLFLAWMLAPPPTLLRRAWNTDPWACPAPATAAIADRLPCAPPVSSEVGHRRGWTVCAAGRSGKKPDVIRKHVVVSGRVQGVFFRDSCQQAAHQYRSPDGWQTGATDRWKRSSKATTTPCEMVEWIRRGPSQADVTDVDVIDERPEGLGDFSVR